MLKNWSLKRLQRGNNWRMLENVMLCVKMVKSHQLGIGFYQVNLHL